MNKYVIDSSVVLDWIVYGENDELSVHRLLEESLNENVRLYTPGFLIIEIINVLRWRYKYKAEKIESVVKRLEDVGIVFVEVGRIDWESLLDLEFKFDLTSYDAHYALVAEKKGLKVITRDEALLKCGVGIKIDGVLW